LQKLIPEDHQNKYKLIFKFKIFTQIIMQTEYSKIKNKKDDFVC